MGTDAKPLHEALSLATLIAVAIHGLALLGDHYLHPTVIEISVPFASTYRPIWTGFGILAGWGLAALGLTYYARARIGAARWRLVHRFIAIFWLLGLIHSLGAGTDAAQFWFLLAVAAPTIPALILLIDRLDLQPREPPPLPSGDQPGPRNM